MTLFSKGEFISLIFSHQPFYDSIKKSNAPWAIHNIAFVQSALEKVGDRLDAISDFASQRKYAKFGQIYNSYPGFDLPLD
jgi:hypothetical protein